MNDLTNNEEIIPELPVLKENNSFIVIDGIYYEQSRIKLDSSFKQIAQVYLYEWVQKPFPNWFKKD